MVSAKRLFLPLMLLAGLSLLFALWAGAVRLGWELPRLHSTLAANHGPLMLVGFLGTLIGLERAVAFKRLWSYGAPVFTGLAGLGILLGFPLLYSQILAVAGSFLLTAIFLVLYPRSPSAHLLTMALGAVLWLCGNILWLSGMPLHQIVPLWAGFLVLTIAGERLELSRLVRLSLFSRRAFDSCVAIFLVGLGIVPFMSSLGVRIAGIGGAILALWLLFYDIAWRSVRQAGLSRFMAICLLAGYFWLAVGSLLWIRSPELFVAGLYYDAMIHAIFLGFVFSMIFAHAPIIFPSITGLAMPFLVDFYVHLGLLHLSLVIRIAANLTGWMGGHRWGGLLNVAAVLLFLLNNIRAVRRGHESSPKTKSS